MVALVLSASVLATAQAPAADERFVAERKLAQLAVDAHGGDKVRNMRTLIIRGSVEVNTGNFPMAGTFATIFSGEKYRIDITNPFQPLTQVFDGKQTSSTVPGGFSLPPVNRLGFPMLPMIGQQGFIVTALPEGKKKRVGFRLTSPEAFYTDFYLDPKTNQIKAYDSVYQMQGRNVTTSVEIDRVKVVEGVTVPERYVQRFDIGTMTVYANFRAREILVNSPVADDVFALAAAE